MILQRLPALLRRYSSNRLDRHSVRENLNGNANLGAGHLTVFSFGVEARRAVESQNVIKRASKCVLTETYRHALARSTLADKAISHTCG